MNIRRFFATDMRQAIRLVREQQGPDAVILSSRKVEGGIEIVSATDYDQTLVSGTLPEAPAVDDAPTHDPLATLRPLSSRGTGDRARERISPRQEALESLPSARASGATSASAAMSRQQVSWTQDPTLVAMRQEIESLRGMLQDQLASLAWHDLRLREPERVRLVRRLEALGLNRELAQEIAGEVRDLTHPDTSWDEALRILGARIPVAKEDILDTPGVIALVGPSGVGKTSTLAKMATRHVQRHGRHSLALVTTDAQRLGAFRQLQTMGQLLGVPAHLAQNARELPAIIAGLQDKQRVFVDTAGLSQRDVRLMDEMAALGKISQLKTLLVVAANAQQRVFEEIFRSFSHLPLLGTVLTKLDEAASLGPVLTALTRAPAPPLCFVSEGQRVPEDLARASVPDLLRCAVRLADDQEPTVMPSGTMATMPSVSRRTPMSMAVVR
jgi:flagellar biosynthesis protein FlhF